MSRDRAVMLLVENLTRLMAERGTNPAELGRLSELNATGIYDIINGKSRSPRLDTVSKIAAALGVPISYLLEASEERQLREHLAAAWSMLPEDGKRRLLLTAQAWVAADNQESA
jgi:transcriptional regulator with XRE-family HTH domain